MLDFGCGFGDLYGYTRAAGIDFDYLGIDLNPRLIEEARRRPSGRPRRASRGHGCDLQERPEDFPKLWTEVDQGAKIVFTSFFATINRLTGGQTDAKASTLSIRSAGRPCGLCGSDDGIRWTRREDACGLDISDGEMVEYAHGFDVGDTRFMTYNGNGYGRSGVGLAVRE